jgi:uncharacterized hydantoinase/oxoprolinase family protein
MSADVAGWDIGGAHLKVARVDATGRVRVVMQVPCALWRGLHELDRAHEAVAAVTAGVARHAVTMTGESADIFPDRRSGVATLCDWVATRLPGATAVFDRDAGLVDAAHAAGPTTSGSPRMSSSTRAWCGRR